MWYRRPVIECEPKATLEAVRDFLKVTGSDPETLRAINRELTNRALHTVDDAGFPRVLRDEPDPFLF